MISGDDRKKLLIIAYCFPPLGGVGTLRTLFLTSHLSKFGWYPHVLTVREGASGQPQDQTLMAKIPPDFKISRTGYWDVTTPLRFLGKFFPSKWIEKLRAGLLPDTYVGWLPFAYVKALRILSNERIDLVYTADLFSAHLVGYLLSKTTGKPWVADVGDEWASNPFRKRLFPGQRKVESWLERKILGAASHIIVAWPGLTKLLSLDKREQCTTITCGFCANDFKSLADITTRVSRERFRITYTGSFYASQQPTYFLNAVQKLIDGGQISGDNIEFVFVGRTMTEAFLQFTHSRISKSIVYTGFVSHHQAIHYLLDTDVLLLIVSSQRGSENIPGKTFEYLASGKPILALVPPEGAAADLIRRTNTGIVVAPEDTVAIRDAVLDLYLQWKQGRLQVQPNGTEICKFETRNLNQSLSEVLDRVSISV